MQLSKVCIHSCTQQEKQQAPLKTRFSVCHWLCCHSKAAQPPRTIAEAGFWLPMSLCTQPPWSPVTPPDRNFDVSSREYKEHQICTAFWLLTKGLRKKTQTYQLQCISSSRKNRLKESGADELLREDTKTQHDINQSQVTVRREWTGLLMSVRSAHQAGF